MKSDDPVVLDLGPRALGATRAILWIHSNVEVSRGSEVICTIRPREPFRPERLAVLAACAESFDLVDFKIARSSVFTTAIPAVRYATTCELRHRPAIYLSGPHRTVVSDETRFGFPIVNRVCSVEHDVSITARHRQDTPPAALEVVVLGTVLSEAEGYQMHLREQQALVQAWHRIVSATKVRYANDELPLAVERGCDDVSSAVRSVRI